MICPRKHCQGFVTQQSNYADIREKGYLYVRSEPHKVTHQKHWVFIWFYWSIPNKVFTQFCSNVLCDYNERTYVRIFHEKKKVS